MTCQKLIEELLGKIFCTFGNNIRRRCGFKLEGNMVLNWCNKVTNNCDFMWVHTLIKRKEKERKKKGKYERFLSLAKMCCFKFQIEILFNGKMFIDGPHLFWEKIERENEFFCHGGSVWYFSGKIWYLLVDLYLRAQLLQRKEWK